MIDNFRLRNGYKIRLMRFPFQQIRFFQLFTPIILLVGMGVGGYNLRLVQRHSAGQYASAEVSSANKETHPQTVRIIIPSWPPELFDRLEPVGGWIAADSTLLPEWADRFQLLGTILGVTQTGPRQPLAVLRDTGLRQGAQRIVRQGERIDPDIHVERITREQVVLRNRFNETARIGLQSSKSSRATESANGVPQGMELTDAATDPTAAFGGRREPDGDQWVFQRDRLMAYYAELRNAPDRMLTVFDSMKPLYTDEGRISGYQLEIEGEPEFFAAVGLQPGDIVRSVNRVPMSSRVHAEHFIGRVVADGLDTIAMEIERDGGSRTFVYLIDE